MVFLILESLGSTELVFILVMALVFFGPRKLPQISRTLGKNVAEFRKASEDFKRTWEREVSLEETSSQATVTVNHPVALPDENSILNHNDVGETLQPRPLEPVAADYGIPREPVDVDAHHSSETGDDAAEETEPLRKRDWL